MWILRGNSAKTIILLIFAIILCLYPLNTTAVIRTFSYEEQGTGIPHVWDSQIYDNGTVVLRIIKINQSTVGNTPCFNEKFSLRIINLDGTVDEKDIDLDIPPFNYCINQRGPIIEEFLHYRLVSENQILIAYYNATNPNDLNTYEEWGMVIDYNGKILSQIPFGPAYVQQQMVLDSSLQFNVNKQKGFLRYNIITNTTSLEWQQYQITPNGVITRLTTGTFTFVGSQILQSISLGTMDESYAIIFANNTNNYNASTPLQPQGQVFLLHIGYNSTATNPLLLYQTPLPNITFTTIYCDISYVGIGQICTLTAVQTDPTGATPGKNIYIRINFLSSGSVATFQVPNNIPPTIESNPIWVVNNLKFGGYLLTNTGNMNMSGILYDENDNSYPWEFVGPVPTNTKGIYGILSNNNTFFVAQLETSNFWQLLVIDLPKFEGNRDKGYSNLNIESTIPPINSIISPNIASKISINFYSPVAPSNGKISIYQMINGQQYLRQSIPDTLCTIENGGITITADILASTFSVSKGNYFITMDNNFVADASYQEPLSGIGNNVWRVTTQERNDNFATSTSGLLRLNVTGTQYFDSLSSNQQRSNFFDTMLDDLSIAIPVSRSRLTSNQRTQIDSTVNEKQYLISVGVLDTRNSSDLSSDSIIKNLNILVSKKDQTPIGTGQVSPYLDETHGFKPAPDLWEKYKTRLLGVFLVIGLLIVLFLFAQRRDNNGNNIAILQLGLIIFDLVMDILFVSSNAKDVPVLFTPSIVFLTVPIGLNTILAFIIITQENTRPKFFQWFAAHGKVASVFTVLSGANIEALSILHSNLAGFPFFRAPFSEDAKSKIFWGACINIIIEDLPQVIIQVIYRLVTVSYDIIPLLALVSSALNLTVNLVGRLYQATNRLKHRHGPPGTDNNSDSDDFGGLVSVSSNKSNLEKLESGENTSREVSSAQSQNYLGELNSDGK